MMKSNLFYFLLFFSCFFLVPKCIYGQASTQSFTLHYPTFELGLGQGLNEFTEVRRYPMFQMHFDYVFTPSKNNHAVELGLQLGIMPFGKKVDNFSGLEITSQAIIFDIGPVLKIRPRVDWKFQPWIDGSLCLGIANTESTYEIVDEPTFIEAFFFGQQTEVEQKKVKSFSDFSLFKGVGVGIDYGIFFFHLKYVQSDPLDFVSKDGVTAKNGEIQYNAISSPVRYLTLGAGINFYKAMHSE